MKLSLEPFIHEVIKRKLNVFGVVVRQQDEILNSFYWNDCNIRRNNINSCTKSVTSLAAGIAIREKVLSLDEKPAEIFPDCLPENPSQYLLDMTIRDMMMMGTGVDECPIPRVTRDNSKETNWTRLCLEFPFKYQPGTHFQYTNMGPYFISVIIQDRTGETLLEWLKPRLFHPLGITNVQWFNCPRGYTLGMGGLHLTTEELSKVGQLCLNKGVWEGKQLIPEDYLAEATKSHIKGVFDMCPTIDFSAGYGYFFWMSDKVAGYRGFGTGGQNFIVLPQFDAVIAVTAYESDYQGILDAIWAGILPELEKQ